MNSNFLEMRLTQHFIFLCFLIISFSSCKTVQKPIKPYFRDSLVGYPAYIDIQVPQVSRIQKEDLLGITVSSLNRESNEILNFSNINSLSLSSLPGGGGGGSQPIGYPVDSSGNISMAFIGKVQVAGLTMEAAQEKIRVALEKYLKDPAVNMRFMNHKYVVLGEVTKVGAYNLLDDRTTIIDALASAGDLTIFGKRDSVTIIRDANGKRIISQVNLLNRDIFKSPYFYVRNGDVIYVEPLPEKLIPQPVDERLRQLQIFTTVTTSLLVLVNIVSQFIK